MEIVEMFEGIVWDYWIVGLLLDCGIVGLWDCGIAGLLIVVLWDYWIVGWVRDVGECRYYGNCYTL